MGLKLISLFPEGERPKLTPLQYREEVQADLEQCRLPMADGSESPTAKAQLTWNTKYDPNKMQKFDGEDDNDEEEEYEDDE